MKNLAFIRDCIATELNNEQHDTETKRLINEAYKYICASFARKLTIERIDTRQLDFFRINHTTP